jgi:hypothetical protein
MIVGFSLLIRGILLDISANKIGEKQRISHVHASFIHTTSIITKFYSPTPPNINACADASGAALRRRP